MTKPKIFISYSWDSDSHKQWVRDLAVRLIHDGIDITLDRWEVVPGTQLTQFMETAVRENDFVLIICTPSYQIKMNNRVGGVGYEGDIMTGEVLAGHKNDKKLIPILRAGEWKDAAASALLSKAYIDLSHDPYREEKYHELLKTLFDEHEKKPVANNGPRQFAPGVPQTGKIELEFSNQEKVRGPLGPPTSKSQRSIFHPIYALIVAPVQQGKTCVLKKLQEEYQRDGKWHTEWFDLENIGMEDPVVELLRRKNIQIVPSSTMNERGASFFTKCHQSSGTEKSLAIFIDTKKITLSHWQNLADFLNGASRKAKDAFSDRDASKRYRVFIASRDSELTKVKTILIENYKKLFPLGYQDVSHAVANVLSNSGIHIDEVKDSYSYDIFYLSSGHPGIIAKIVEKFIMNSNSVDLETFLRKYREKEWKDDIHDYAERTFRETVFDTINDPESLKIFAKQICVFRYFDRTIAGAILHKIDENKTLPLLLGDLAYEPNKDDLYTDGVMRDLMSLDMLINHPKEFSEQCLEAKKMCLEQIEKTTNHVQFINEYLFQSFQFLLAEQGGNINIWDKDAKEKIKGAFKQDFIELVKKLKKMYPDRNRVDICHQMRNQLAKSLELHELDLTPEGRMVMRDETLRSFRFIVNFIYKEAYSDNQETIPLFEAGWERFTKEISELINKHMVVNKEDL